MKQGNRNIGPTFKGLAAIVGLAIIGAVIPADAAKTTLVAFSEAKWGTIDASGRGTISRTKIRKIVHYEYTFGGHDQANTRNHLTRLANKYGFALERWTTQSDVTASNLLGVDILVLNQGDGDVLEPAASSYVTAVKNFVEVQGKGLLAVHAAAAYVPCPTSGVENLTDAGCRWLARVLVRQYFHHDNDNTKARIYADSVLTGQIPPGATGAAAVASARDHGRKNIFTRSIYTVNGVNMLPTNGGSTPALNQPYVWDGVGDEWYNYRGFVRLQGSQTFDGVVFGAVNVLISLDESGYTSSNKIGDRSETWTRTVGAGLTAYNNMGHSNVWVRTRTGNALGTATVADSMPEKFNWRLLKYLARDFIGCMDPAYAEYNSEASVTNFTSIDPVAPCVTPTSVRFEKGAKLVAGLAVTSGVIRIPTMESGSYAVTVSDANGRKVFFRSAVGGAGRKIEINGLTKGTYMVRVSTPKSEEAIAKVTL
jgi:hypothetical protein